MFLTEISANRKERQMLRRTRYQTGRVRTNMLPTLEVEVKLFGERTAVSRRIIF